jgi:chromosome segregation ATPase
VNDREKHAVLDVLVKEVVRLQDELEDIRSIEARNLQEQVEELEAMNKDLCKEVEKWQDNCDTLATSEAKLMKERDEFRAAYKGRDLERETLRYQRDSNKRLLEEIRRERDTARARVEELVKERDEFRSVLSRIMEIENSKEVPLFNEAIVAAVETLRKYS